MNILDFIIDYEAGDVDEQQFIEGFADLIRTGQAWCLQGSYGRTAVSLIDQGIISSTGEILSDLSELF
jgi:hypothetical protein